MMQRGFLRTLAQALAGLIVVTQMTIAAYACPGLQAAIADAARVAVATADPAPMRASGADRVAALLPDCNGMPGTPDAGSANLCAEHCKYGQQSDHAPGLTVPAALLNALYTTPRRPEPTFWHHAAGVVDDAAAAAPPHAIQHCVFRL